MKINVQFIDSKNTAICAFFSDPQVDEEDYPNQGVVELSDKRWKEYYESLNAFTQAMLPAPE
jgi:hypothetical protein